MKKYLIQIGIVLLLIATIVVGYNKYKELNQQLSRAVENNKAYAHKQDTTTVRAYNMTINEVKQYGDSIDKEMLKMIKDNGIKEKNIINTHYIKEYINTKDTIVVNDTIFRDKNFALDTTIQNDWYKVRVGLKYPDTVAVSPEFTSEKYVVVNTKRETIDPPKKCFFLRWFQKKHNVTEVTIFEKNPYIKVKEQKFIQYTK